MVEEISRTRWKQEKDRYEDGETEGEESQEVNAKRKEFEQVSLDMAFKEDYKRLLGRGTCGSLRKKFAESIRFNNDKLLYTPNGDPSQGNRRP